MQGDTVQGAIANYVGREVQLTVRGERDGADDAFKLDLFGTLRMRGERFVLTAGEELVFAHLFVDDETAVLTQWQDGQTDMLGDDWIGFSAAGISVTVGISRRGA